MWSRKFLAKAQICGYRIAFEGNLSVPIESLETQDKNDLESRKINQLAFCELMLSCTDTLSFACIDDARTKELSSGDSKKEWSNLKSKCEPSSGSSKLILKREFGERKLGNNEDPDMWIMHLESIRRMLMTDHHIETTDEDMMLLLGYGFIPLFHSIYFVYFILFCVIIQNQL